MKVCKSLKDLKRYSTFQTQGRNSSSPRSPSKIGYFTFENKLTQRFTRRPAKQGQKAKSPPKIHHQKPKILPSNSEKRELKKLELFEKPEKIAIFLQNAPKESRFEDIVAKNKTKIKLKAIQHKWVLSEIERTKGRIRNDFQLICTSILGRKNLTIWSSNSMTRGKVNMLLGGDFLLEELTPEPLPFIGKRRRELLLTRILKIFLGLQTKLLNIKELEAMSMEWKRQSPKKCFVKPNHLIFQESQIP